MAGCFWNWGACLLAISSLTTCISGARGESLQLGGIEAGCRQNVLLRSDFPDGFLFGASSSAFQVQIPAPWALSNTDLRTKCFLTSDLIEKIWLGDGVILLSESLIIGFYIILAMRRITETNCIWVGFASTRHFKQYPFTRRIGLFRSKKWLPEVVSSSSSR